MANWSLLRLVELNDQPAVQAGRRVWRAFWRAAGRGRSLLHIPGPAPGRTCNAASLHRRRATGSSNPVKFRPAMIFEIEQGHLAHSRPGTDADLREHLR